MNRQPRFEIVRSDAKQPWRVREIAANGKQTWKSSENYARRASALWAMVGHARSVHPELKVWLSTGTGGPEIRVGLPSDTYATAHRIEVREVDERA